MIYVHAYERLMHTLVTEICNVLEPRKVFAVTVSSDVRDNFQCQSRTLRLLRLSAVTCLQHGYRCVCVLLRLHKRKGFCCVIENVKSGRLYQQRCGSDLHDAALQETSYAGVPFGAVYGVTPSICEHQLHPETNLKVMRSCAPQ